MIREGVVEERQRYQSYSLLLLRGYFRSLVAAALNYGSGAYGRPWIIQESARMTLPKLRHPMATFLSIWFA